MINSFNYLYNSNQMIYLYIVLLPVFKNSIVTIPNNAKSWYKNSQPYFYILLEIINISVEMLTNDTYLN